MYSCWQSSRYLSSLFLATSPTVLTGQRLLIGLFSVHAPTLVRLVEGFTPLGGPTFRVLNLASHPFLLISLPSSLPLSPCSSSSGTLATFFLLPTSLV